MNQFALINWAYLGPGLLIGLFGWICYRFGSAVIGAVVGAGALGMLGYLASGLFPQYPNGAPIAIGAGAVLGAVGGVIFVRALLTYLFFLAGAAVGSAVALRLAHGGIFGYVPSAASGWGLTVTIIAGTLLGGFALMAARRYVIAIVTSIAGAALCVTGMPPSWQSDGALLTLLIVFIVVQAGLVRRYVDRETFDRHSMHGRYRDEMVAVRER